MPVGGSRVRLYVQTLLHCGQAKALAQDDWEKEYIFESVYYGTQSVFTRTSMTHTLVNLHNILINWNLLARYNCNSITAQLRHNWLYTFGHL